MCSPAGACVRPEQIALRSVLLSSSAAHILMLQDSSPADFIQKPKYYLLASQLCPCAAAGLCSKPC